MRRIDRRQRDSRFLRPRLAALAMLCLAAIAARADSSTGADTAIAGAMGQGIAAGSRAAEPDPDPKRSPFGLPYGFRERQPEMRASPSGQWSWRGEIEAGALGAGGDHGNPLFSRHRDADAGFHLRHLALEAVRRDSAAFVEAIAGSIARSDRHHSVVFGRYNAWQVKAWRSDTPSVSTDTFHSLWNGVGGDRATLATLAAGGQASPLATQAALREAIAASGPTRLAVTRGKSGVRADLRLDENWRLHAAYTHERKRGASPFGMTFGGGDGGGSIETAEPVNATTHDFRGGIGYFDGTTSLNISLQGSLFRNEVDTVVVDNPLRVFTQGIAGVSPSAFTAARFDLAPDNDFYKAKAEYARTLPRFMNARVSVVAAATRSTQDDRLVAPTLLPLAGGSLDGVPAANAWNTVEALTRQAAGARIDTTLLDLGLALQPAPRLAVRASLRRYATENESEYLACNPLTGQWGRLINDGSGASLVATPEYLAARCDLAAVRALGVAPSAGDIPIRAVARDYRQDRWRLAGDWRIASGTSLAATVERETFHRSNRERDRTDEDRLKLAFSHRGGGSTTAVVSLEAARRRGSEYRGDATGEAYSASLGPLPSGGIRNYASWIRTVDGLRRYDLADRDLQGLDARLGWAASPVLDFGITAHWKGTRYPGADFGRVGSQRHGSLGVDANWQPTEKLALFGHYAWQAQDQRQAGLQPNSCISGLTYYFFSDGTVNTTGIVPPGSTLVGTTAVADANALAVCGTATPLSPLFPTSRAWEHRQESRNHVAGLGLKRDFGAARLEASFTWESGRTATRHAYDATALALTPAQVALIGDGLPEARLLRRTLEASLAVPINASLSARLYLRHERGRIRDWHYDGVATNPVPDIEAAYLDTGPRDYRASTVGAFLRLDF
ncbi:MAG: MtrB/PioB family outer membrane beta-barrel protein [Burkholderiales bacterium]